MFTVIGKISSVLSEGKKHKLVIAITEEFSVESSYYSEVAPIVDACVIAQCRPINLDKEVQVIELDAISLIEGVVSDFGVFATVLGTLGRDPELTNTTSGKSLTKTSIAVKGNARDKTVWLKLVGWGKNGETVSSYLTKGSQALFSGEVTRKTWTNKEGVIKVDFELNLKSMSFVGKKEASAAPSYTPQATPTYETADIAF